MAHFVAVCIFCVLSTSHLPCFAHNDFLAAKQVNSSDKIYSEIPTTNTEHTYSKHRIDFSNGNLDKDEYIYNEVPKDSSEDDFQESRQNDLLERLGQTDTYNSRNKRSTELDYKYFTERIFSMFGDGENMTMDGFEKLLKKLGLFQQRGHAVSAEEIHSVDSNQSADRLANSKDVVSNNDHDGHRHEHSKQKCLSSVELLSALSDGQYDSISAKNNNNHSAPLPPWIFEKVCPALIYQLASADSKSRNCIKLVNDEEASSRFEDNHTLVVAGHEHDSMATRNMFKVWVYSTVSIVIISLCGLLGVAVIPVMGKSYYQQLLQFLVALAVGTLCGDALIHLLPHAMMSESAHGHTHSANESNGLDAHTANMWKGFVAMIGLVMFFFTEKLLNMISECRRNDDNQRQIPAHLKVMREVENINSNNVGEKLCKHRYQAYHYPYGEISTEAQENLHQHNHREKPQGTEEEKPLTCNSTNCVTVCNRLSTPIQNDVDNKKCDNDDWKLDDNVINDTKKTVADGSDVPLNDPESYAVIIRDHDIKHHGHGHSHNHVHPSSDSMSSVAWMVVLGDGLHNFTDGMAIGAAFSANIAGGFSTTIAVFCHELPHELGDFAVLLKAGMSAKQAVFYNLLSSVLCLFGMVFGVLLGATPEASSWMFAAAAGMFIYIALVDMIPELSSNPSWRFGALWNMFLQTSGLISGFSIMLLIALYEHDLQNLFNS